MTAHRPTFQVVDLAFGDCGKGTVVDYLARRLADNVVGRFANGSAASDAAPVTVVRFNGGPQAAHNVVAPDGRHHTFAQFGSGSFVPGVGTFLSRFVLVEPYALLNEAAHLTDVGVPDPLSRLTLDARCPVITPAHQAANRLRELARGGAAHGTCGMGIGETMQDALDHPDLILHAGELGDRRKVLAKLRAACELKREQLRGALASARDVIASEPASVRAVAFARNAATILEPTWLEAAADNYALLARSATVAHPAVARRLLRDAPALVFEGAQGVLLDENFGFHPHTTWSTTTFANADALLDEAGRDGPRTRLGVLRSYFTRHGAGPFVTNADALALRERHNGDAGWQGKFRVGPFDAVAARYALDVVGRVDALALTHLDCLDRQLPTVCTAYETPPTVAGTNAVADGGEASYAADDEHFVRADDGRATAIRHRSTIDLDRQGRLTEKLRACRPAYESLDTADTTGFVRQIEGLLNARVAITSAGPTANDKREVGGFQTTP